MYQIVARQVARQVARAVARIVARQMQYLDSRCNNLLQNWAYWSFFRIKSFKVPIIAYICGIYKFMYAKNAFSAALKRSSVMEK
ncbi:MAG: hypothetical protein J6I72_01040, partial [Muribaculaceae bacterium]|nr:hypothetical protein [Muribaculaceae bacterium]